MPDRYANGDRGNDDAGVPGPRGTNGYDPTDPGWYHGGDLAGLTGDCTGARHGLARIRDLGFTALWMTPVVKQKWVQGLTAAYHGYWGLDFTTVDPHLGTDQDFANLVSCAHSLGMEVYLDVVVNHTADVISLPPRTYSNAPFRDCTGETFDAARYAGGSSFPCLAPAFMPQVPSLPVGEEHAKKPEWLNDPTRYHDRGDIDFGSCSEPCFEQGDFYGLDDLFTEEPTVVDGLADLYASWITRFKVDGFRVDTARHVNAAFFRVWVPKILAAARSSGTTDFPIFGEVALTDLTELAPFVRDRGLPEVLDFPFQDAAAGFAAGETSASALADRLRGDDYLRTPSGVEPTPPTFLGNHDMGRAAYEIEQRSHAHGDTLLRRVLLGYDVLYLLRGAPVVMYGDEVGMMGSGGDQQARQDMFSTQVPEWKTQERVGSTPIGDRSSFDVSSPIAAHLRELAKLRDDNPALSTGSTVIRRVRRNVLVVSRIDAATRHEEVVALNSGTAAARAGVTTSTPKTLWTPLLGSPRIAQRGRRLQFDVPALGAVLLRAGSSVPATAPSKPRVRVTADDISRYWRVSAAVHGATVSVTFAVHRPGGAWQRLAIDDAPPYRAFLHPARFRRGERLALAAVARSLDGRTAVSATVRFRMRPR